MLFHHLRHIKAADCFFAYRMVLVQLRREMPMEQVKITRPLPNCLSERLWVPYRLTPQHARIRTGGSVYAEQILVVGVVCHLTLCYPCRQ